MAVAVSASASRHAAVLGLLACAAIWGTLARLGLGALNTYDGQSIAPVLWAQGVGCLIMGWTIGNRSSIEPRYPPLYTAITTGLCGSITTFSVWILEVFRAFGDQKHYDRGGLQNVLDALTQTIATLAIAHACLVAGEHFSRAVSFAKVLELCGQWRKSAAAASPAPGQDAQSPAASQDKPRGSAATTRGLDVGCLAIGLALWVGAALLCALYAPWRHITFSLVLAPPGTVLRWYLSRLNAHPSATRLRLPLGTLAANLLGTAVVCAAFVLQRVGRTPGTGTRGAHTALGCAAAYGLESGFCGCLSTISTFAVELRASRPRHAVWYASVSWLAGIVICVLLVGAPWWSIGMDGSCKTLYPVA